MSLVRLVGVLGCWPSVVVSAFLLIGSVTVFAQEEQVEETASRFEYVPSQIGIDYWELTDWHSPMSEILSQGEQEFLTNAAPVFGDESPEMWRGVSRIVANNTTSRATINGLRRFTPDMLRMMAVGLDPNDPIYAYIWSEAGLFVSEDLAAVPSE